MTSQLINYSKVDRIAIIELNDPPANTYSYEMMKQMDEAILEARMDREVDVIVLRGAGEKFFCAGANIRMLAEVSPEFKYYFCLHANETLNRLEQTPKLVIAALNGHTVGGGLEVALAADVRIARRGGGRIGLPEVNLGVLPGTGGTQRLARLVGKARAIEMMVSGATYDFDEALRLGLVNAVYDDEGFFDKVLDFARQFTLPGRACLAVGAIKRAVQSGLEMGLHEGLALERELQQQLFRSSDAKEGLSAYLEKRRPSFRGE
ncbi:MAG: enoyl-CoA hydratase-related protein [Acidobacteriota bacterium]|nr:enoyl-CoA hydratase-related protein [Blastocatellia bacterium]MDW8412866.1 enoyl-CoA hydratase-related protein [Acidobacteriota bacterium]